MLIVAALKPLYGIGFEGKMPWRLSKEMAYFKNTTTRAPPGSTNAVIMGSTTWSSIPDKFRPLPGRINAVLSRSAPNTVDADGVVNASSIESALDLIQRHASKGNKSIHRIFIMGGAQVYNTMVRDPRVRTLLLTDISYTGDTISMDTFLEFPLDAEWTKQSHQSLEEFVDLAVDPKVSEKGFDYQYQLWTKN